MKRRSFRILGFVIAILVVLGGAAGFFIWHSASLQHQSANTNITINGFPVVTGFPPTPGPTRITYINTKYNYTFVYPSEWKLREYTHQNVDTVDGQYQVIAGDSYPFQVDCQTNPEGLDAQTWSNKVDAGTGIGYVTLKSGLTAYLYVEYGQVGVDVYIFTHNHAVCSVGVIISNQANNDITDAIVNSFKWQ